MSRPTVLIRVNYLLAMPGYAEPFSAAHMRYDQETQQLLVRTPEGLLRFDASDTIPVRVLDLDTPAIIRAQQLDSGWENMTLGALVTMIRASDLLTQ